ncbi:MAG TPA: hypothetical protein PKN32_12935 [Bacteroidales bacterium]|nr:hypothetical protein [Bacteroidales bacterium]
MNNLTRISLLSFIVALLVFFCSCDKEDQAAKYLHNGTDIWKVESIQYLEYDTTGNIISDTTIIEPGEFVFFQEVSSYGADGYHQGIFINYDENIGYTLDYVIDKYRFKIIDYSGPFGFDKLYTITELGKQKQEWIYIINYNDLGLDWEIRAKEIVKISKKGYN